ncbi:MAG: Ribonuclease [Nitrosomonadaceae bacterium]|nr:Ribonuclease [Nitrosomonadaceae bacterium]
MTVPTQSLLALPQALRALCEQLFHGDTLSEQIQPLARCKLGYWSHCTDQNLDRDVQETIQEGLAEIGIWDRFDHVPNKWLFGNADILKRHTAFSERSPVGRAGLVALNPNVMPRYTGPNDIADIEFVGLGGCQSIGTSCYAYRHRSTVLLVDIGIQPDSNDLPSFDLLPPAWTSEFCGMVLTHLHADHANGLTQYKPELHQLGALHLPDGIPIYCSEETARLFSDVIRMSANDGSYGAPSLSRTTNALLKRLHPLPMNTWHRVGDVSIRLIPYPHVPGSTLVEIGTPGHSVLHAVDFAADRALGGQPFDWTGISDMGIRSIVLESTYGQVEQGEHWRQLRLPALFSELLDLLDEKLPKRNTRILFPTFSFGRAQEISDVLELRHPDSTTLDGTAAALSKAVRQCAPNWKKTPVHDQNQTESRNIVASHGWMYEGSTSHSWYNRLTPDDVVVFTGYIRPGTPAWRIKEAARQYGKPRVISVPMSAHASLSQLLALVTATGAGRVVLVHGSHSPSAQLSIDDVLWSRGFEVHRPQIGQIVTL